MTSPFADLVDDMDDSILDVLNDGTGTYLDRQGNLLAEEVPLIIERSVERFSEAGAMDRVTTYATRKALLQPFDRQGAFLVGGKTWHIDGIASDDGHMITLYVKP